jgi:hypothetical protein
MSPLGGFDDFGDSYDLEPGGVMYDGETDMGPWANMTEKSWKKFGTGKLGLGHGQKYVMQEDGRWLKVEG